MDSAAIPGGMAVADRAAEHGNMVVAFFPCRPWCVVQVIGSMLWQIVRLSFQIRVQKSGVSLLQQGHHHFTAQLAVKTRTLADREILWSLLFARLL